MSNLGSRLRDLRKSSRYSQEKLAQELGVSQVTISNYEKGIRIPDAQFLSKLKELTNVDLNWLISGTPQSIDFPNDSDLQEFLYYLKIIPLVRHSALTDFAKLKESCKDIFRKVKPFLENKIINSRGKS